VWFCRIADLIDATGRVGEMKLDVCKLSSDTNSLAHFHDKPVRRVGH
jgi:hypothetical protein